MARISDLTQTQCPVARAESVVGDSWTVLVLRELFFGNHRFDEIQALTGATPQMVATRLKKLETNGVVERRTYSLRPVRYEYHLTKKGADLFQVMMALRAWGEKWLRVEGEDRSIEYVHADCGHLAGLGPLCDHCGELLKREDLSPQWSPGSTAERAAQRAAFRESRSRA